MFFLFVTLLQGKNHFLSASLNFIYEDNLNLSTSCIHKTSRGSFILIFVFKITEPTVNLMT